MMLLKVAGRGAEPGRKAQQQQQAGHVVAAEPLASSRSRTSKDSRSCSNSPECLGMEMSRRH